MNRDKIFYAGTGRLALYVAFLGAFLFISFNQSAIVTILTNRSVYAAAAQNQFEPETANVAGAQIVADASASDGKYIQFGSIATNTTVPSATLSPTNTSFQPMAPYYATFYYMWYKNPKTDGAYSYWSDPHVDAGSPPNTWFSHYLPDSNTAAFDPAGELYSANDYTNFKWQVAKMKEAKLEAAIASWWGPGTKEDVALSHILKDFMARSDNPYPNLRWAVYYEDEGFADPAVSTLVADLNHIKSDYASSPYYLRVNGKPVIFVYGGQESAATSTRWAQANAQVGNAFYTVLKVHSGYISDADQPDSWHQYAPAVRTDNQGKYSFSVSPGFWLDNPGSAERLARDSAAFTSAVNQMNASSATWRLVETWNEWGEGSGVEPAQKVKFNSATGKDELDTSAPAAYGVQNSNLYIDILRNTLPPLEQ